MRILRDHQGVILLNLTVSKSWILFSENLQNPLFEIRKIHHPVSSVVHPSSREEKRVKCYIKSRPEKINKCVISFCQAAPSDNYSPYSYDRRK